MLNSLKAIYRDRAPSQVKSAFRSVMRGSHRLGLTASAFRAVAKSAITANQVARPSFFGDGFSTVHHVEFNEDDAFMASFATAIDGIPPILVWKDLIWRAHICAWAAKQALALDEGDFVECGVYYGVISKTICEYTDFANSGRNYYLLDSWGPLEGYHPSYPTDIYAEVGKRFAAYKNVHMVRGMVPEVLAEVPSKKIAYLAIDMNSSQPELATLERFYDRMVPGGIIYFDDYGWQFPELRRVVNQFFKDKPETLLHFPSGNSIVVKI